MVDTDIILDKGRITVVGTPAASVTGKAVPGADLALTTDPAEDPDIKLNPSVASATFGGGGSRLSDGKVTIRDEAGNGRVELAAAPGGERSEFVVRDDGGNRRVELATPSPDSDRTTGELVISDDRENPRVQVSSQRDARRDPSQTGVWINGQDGIVQLGEPQTTGTDPPHIELEGNSGIVSLSSDPQSRNDFSIRLDPQSGHILAGGGGADPPSGGVELRDSEGDEGLRAEVGAEDDGVHARLRVATRGLAGVDLYTVEPDEQGDPSAGVATFYDSAGYNAVEVRGDQGALRLGYSVPASSDGSTVDPTEAPTAIATGAGTSGTLFLDDGNPGIVGDGTVFSIKATEGRLEISATGTSDPVFVVDPADQSIRTASGWTFETQ